jgi:toxin ParE1/3/4
VAYRLTLKAEDDIVALTRFGRDNFGVRHAVDYAEGLFDLFELIAANPALSRERTELTPPVRIHRYKAHLVVYMIDGHGEVIIVRIRHGHEDWLDNPV